MLLVYIISSSNSQPESLLLTKTQTAALAVSESGAEAGANTQARCDKYATVHARHGGPGWRSSRVGSVTVSDCTGMIASRARSRGRRGALLHQRGGRHARRATVTGSDSDSADSSDSPDSRSPTVRVSDSDPFRPTAGDWHHPNRGAQLGQRPCACLKLESSGSTP